MGYGISRESGRWKRGLRKRRYTARCSLRRGDTHMKGFSPLYYGKKLSFKTLKTTVILSVSVQESKTAETAL